jgi:hypothetical protein
MMLEKLHVAIVGCFLSFCDTVGYLSSNKSIGSKPLKKQKYEGKNLECAEAKMLIRNQ